MLMVSLRHGYTNLFNFRGRDSRRLFWPFALVHVAVVIVSTTIVMVPPILSSFGRLEAFARENPDKVTVTYEPGSVSYRLNEPVPGLMPDIRAMLAPIGVVVLIFMVLVAAAVARRLHDTGRIAWLGAVPAVLFCAAMVVMVPVFSAVDEGGEADLRGFFASFVLNLLYNVSLVVLVVLLAMKSESADNRYGPPNDPNPTP